MYVVQINTLKSGNFFLELLQTFCQPQQIHRKQYFAQIKLNIVLQRLETEEGSEAWKV